MSDPALKVWLDRDISAGAVTCQFGGSQSPEWVTNDVSAPPLACSLSPRHRTSRRRKRKCWRTHLVVGQSGHAWRLAEPSILAGNRLF